MLKLPPCLGTQFLEADTTSVLQIVLGVPSPHSSPSSARCALELSALFLIGNLYSRKG